MTETPQPPFPVTPGPGSQLEQLMSMLDAAEAARDEAKQRAETIRAGIAAEAARLAAGANGGQLPPGILIAGAPGWRARIMRWHGDKTTFDAGKFEADYPGLLDLPRYRKPVKPYWDLRKA
jgi:hypothetical protein